MTGPEDTGPAAAGPPAAPSAAVAPGAAPAVTVLAVAGLPEITAGTDLAALIAAAVAAHYGPELIDGWLVDDQDKPAADDPALAGIEVRALPLLMRDLPATTAIARAALDLALELR